MGSVRTLLQLARAQCLRLSERFFPLKLWSSNMEHINMEHYNDHRALSCGCDSGSKRSKVKVAALGGWGWAGLSGGLSVTYIYPTQMSCILYTRILTLVYSETMMQCCTRPAFSIRSTMQQRQDIRHYA